MKKLVVLLLLVAAIIFACNQIDETTNTPDAAGQTANVRLCPDTTAGNILCPTLPYTLDTVFGLGYTATLDPRIQTHFDVFSWQTFTALNWPADAEGHPLGNSMDAYPDSPRVWEHYPDLSEIFYPKHPLHLQLQQAKNNNLKFFYRISKGPKHRTAMQDIVEPDGNPLIDRNLNFAVFEVKANPVEANFIAKHNLTSQYGIDTFYKNHHDEFQLPASIAPANGQAGNAGSMEIKTSWRILDTAKGDKPSRFYTRKAIIYIGAANSVSGKPFTIRATVGLVGMHIIRKTSDFNQWIWSTFEQIDNTPDNIQEAQYNYRPVNPWSFYYPTTLGLIPNQPPAFQPGDDSVYRFGSTPPYAQRYAREVPGEHGKKGTQAQRMYPVYYRTDLINYIWRNKLKGTVWEHYRLIGSQWTRGDGPAGTTPNVPAILGNSSMETFELINASCISCHRDARVIVGKDSIVTDFSFMIALHAK